MDRSTVITLLAETTTKNDYGVRVTAYTERDVYAQLNSITRAEFYDAGRNGLNPEFMFSMFAGDYQGERVVKYNGNTYAVYRTYFDRTDRVELYVQREGGTNGIPAPTTASVAPSTASTTPAQGGTNGEGSESGSGDQQDP